MKNTALITGASSGLGKEFAYIHAREGNDVAIVARSEQKLQDLKKDLESEYSIQVYVIVKDLNQVSAPQEIYDELKQQKIDIKYLINNAGFGGIGAFHERDMQNDLDMIGLNVTTLTALTRLFLPDFIKQDSGKILNVSSTASLVPGPLQAVYYASKAYVTSFSNALSGELMGTNVTVTNLMPGATETEFGKISGMDKTQIFKTTAKASDVAQDGYDAMIQGKINIISGLTFIQKLMFIFLPFIPKKMILKQVYNMQKTK